MMGAKEVVMVEGMVVAAMAGRAAATADSLLHDKS
jgi:hypothetical protein